MRVRRGGVQAVRHVDGRFHPITVKVREPPGGAQGKRPCRLPGPGRARVRSRRVLRPVDPRVLMPNRLVGGQPRKGLVHELGAVVCPEALLAVTNVE